MGTRFDHNHQLFLLVTFQVDSQVSFARARSPRTKGVFPRAIPSTKTAAFAGTVFKTSFPGLFLFCHSTQRKEAAIAAARIKIAAPITSQFTFRFCSRWRLIAASRSCSSRSRCQQLAVPVVRVDVFQRLSVPVLRAGVVQRPRALFPRADAVPRADVPFPGVGVFRWLNAPFLRADVLQ